MRELRGEPKSVAVAFSFAGEQRETVEAIASKVEERLGTGTVFYDRWYQAFLSGPGALPRLRRIYAEDAELVVVCQSRDYDGKSWPTEEREAIDGRRIKFRNLFRDRDYHEELVLIVGNRRDNDLSQAIIALDVEDSTHDGVVDLIVAKLELARQGRASLQPANGAETRERDLTADAIESGTPLSALPVDRFSSLRFGGVPYLRIEPLRGNDGRISVNISCKTGSSSLLKVEKATVKAKLDASSIITAIFSHDRFRRIVSDFSAANGPSRIQVCFEKSAQELINLSWESATWPGSTMKLASKYLFSRQIMQSTVEPGALPIRPKNKIDYVEHAYQTSPEDDDQSWSQAAQMIDQPNHTLARLFDAIEHAEVLTLAIPVRSDLRFAAENEIGVVKSYEFRDLEDRLQALLNRKKGPSLIILSPRDSSYSGLTLDLAQRLAAIGVPAVLGVIRRPGTDTDISGPWRIVHENIIQELRQHALIDAAVARNRLLAEQHGMDLVLYLRSKSARLWYEPMFTRSDGHSIKDEEAWSSLQFNADVKTVPPIAVFIGSSYDDELSVSRRELASRMAAVSGFALSRKESEDLGIVCDYVEIRGSKEGEKRPHVALFMKELKRRLLELNPRLAAEYEHKSTEELLQEIAENRVAISANSEDAHAAVARIKANAYITVYYHDLLERSLAREGRKCVSETFEYDRPSQAKVPKLSVEQPLVYHAFGSFDRRGSILLSRVDHLRFFEGFCKLRDDYVFLVERLMSESVLIFLGFKPASEHLRMLLQIYEGVGGNKQGELRPKVAVQVDPEDDHTSDPDGARDYYQGMLAKLGSQVYIFWGPPDIFLAKMELARPGLFLPRSKSL